MAKIFEFVRSRIGEFWFNSLMLFCAMRVTDAMNMFVGLWLVPSCIDPSELGAVMPLTTFASFVGLPAYIFAITFTKEMTHLVAHGEYGRLKSLMRGVFIAVGGFTLIGVIIAWAVLPIFLDRIRVARGSLGILIIISAFLGCVFPIYANALQALKRFRTMSILGIVAAPVRLLVMLVAMPFRPLSGYFAGQAALPAFHIVAAIFCLRKELAVKAEPYWEKPVVRRLAFLFVAIAAYQGAGLCMGLVETTVLRQRLPDIDSAAYYMVSRFSDITAFLTTTLLTTLFPYTAELAEQGRSTRPLVIKSTFAMLVFAGILAVGFAFFGEAILRFLPHGSEYAPYAWAIPWLIGINALYGIQNFHTNTEVSAGRFGFLKWWVPVNLGLAVVMMLVTGYGYFVDYIPASWTAFLQAHNITDLQAMLGWMTAQAVLKVFCCAIELSRSR